MSKAQTHEFKTELKQILDIIIHSLYSKKEIFLRELISNAADAIDKVRFQALTDSSLLEGNTDWKIQIIPDEKLGTITIRDNGIGMSQQTIVENLGTIARSGTKLFLENLKKADVQNRPELIGQFGVGFYASFMVADQVTVISRTAGNKADGALWRSDGQGQYTVEAVEKETRGTDIIVHLREDAKEFLSPWRIRQIVKQYSDFIEHPVVMEVEEEKEGKKEKKLDTLNSRKAIWLKNKSEIKPEEYNEFYKQVARDTEDPARVIHIAAEGTMEFKALLYVPKNRPFDFYWREPKSSVGLYVRRVLITHDSEELLPGYLRFVKGVVDSADLPLNVSREMLQHNPLLAKIRSNLVNRVLKTMEEMIGSEYDAYVAFFEQFGAVLKEGISQDYENRQRLSDLLLWESTKTQAGKYTTLAKYVEAMPTDQKEIYFLTGESRAQLEHSPYLESFRARGHEVLLLTDPIDEFVTGSMFEYKGKKLKAIDRGDISSEVTDEQKKAAEKLKGLFDAVKEKLGNVGEVRASVRLKESAACLVGEDHAMSANMERMMRRAGRDTEIPQTQRILELNAEHPVVQTMQKIFEKDAADARLENWAKILYDQAVIAEGNKVADPAAFARRINDLLVKTGA